MFAVARRVLQMIPVFGHRDDHLFMIRLAPAGLSTPKNVCRKSGKSRKRLLNEQTRLSAALITLATLHGISPSFNTEPNCERIDRRIVPDFGRACVLAPSRS
jgi:hypothetical protein